MGKLSRNKGASEERRIANLYKQLGWNEARRFLGQYQESSGRDIENVEPFCIQVKTGKSAYTPGQMAKALSEAFEEALKGEIPIVHSRKNGESEGIVFMHEKDWFVFVECLSNFINKENGVK